MAAKDNVSEMVLIQTKLNAPKNQRNTFGNYNYRSCEDILEAVKPLLKETNCTLTITDEVVQVADRIYVKATATLKTPSGEVFTTSAFAREPLSKKGADESQITGAASSYARKYALNGLFCIDDNKDTDVTNKESASKPSETKVNNELQAAFELILPNIKTAPSREYLDDIQVQNPALREYPPYREAMNKRVLELRNGGTAKK